MIIDILLLIIGFIFIIKASDVLVDSASNLALKLKVPKILIALTIVSFGTCAPEVAISFQSISSSDSAIAFANVIGSCIVNVFDSRGRTSGSDRKKSFGGKSLAVYSLVRNYVLPL